MPFRPPSPADGQPPEPISAGAGLGLAGLATLLCSAALRQILYGLIAGRSGRLVAGLLIAALGGFLLAWVARRAEEWRLAVAAASALAGFYYSWTTQIATKDFGPLGGPDGGLLFSDHTAAISTALILFIVAGIALGRHILRSWGE
ncbi:MAG TPA: hypothetical protein VN851_14200 [Thermoanaerobaculia bacterium]|nr:hypothetical protein [Thermoanaerobaculia bacterium]